MRSCRVGYVGWGLVLSLLSASDGAYAQVILDGTMGPAGRLSGPDYQIRAEYGRQRGGNLFHSFGVFNVNTGQSATFSGPNSVQNIISRVTWGYPSSINGTLRSTIPNANLFLLNPAGVLFGPNAKLDVSGSFHVSTADYLRLGENDRFYADPTKTSVLSTAPIMAFGFLGNTPAAVRFWGSNLQVPAGKTLAVVAGDVKVGEKVGNTIFKQSTLAAPGGRVEITAVASPGEVVPTAAGPETGGFQKMGAIDVKYNSKLSVEGEGGGAIFIRAGQFTVDSGTVNANTTGSGDGGGIDVQVKELAITQDGEFRADNYGSGSGPGIRVEAETITLDSSGFMAARARGTGSGGNLTLSAGKAVNITGTVVAGSLATGDGGALCISTPELNLADGGIIASASFSQGRGADMVLNVDRLTLSSDGIIDLTARGTGHSGNLTITADNLTLNSGGNIDVSTRGTGHGGDLTITANDARISGGGQYPSGLYMVSYGAGDAGKLILSTKGTLAIDDKGVITGESGENATGRGADISIDVDRLELRGVDVSTSIPSAPARAAI